MDPLPLRGVRRRLAPLPLLRAGVLSGACMAAFLAADIAAAQDPPPTPPRRPPPDSVRAAQDSAAVPQDSAQAAPEVPDSVRLIPAPPSFPDRRPEGWDAGVWAWNRDELLASGALSLSDLLQRIPGVTGIRSGFLGLPEAASVFGGGAGSVQLVLDGFALDPLAAGAFDLSRLELVQLARVRVTRTAAGLRVEVESLRASEERPFSMIEAGTGDLETNLFRGIFLAPRLLGGSVGLGVERLDTDGLGRREPASTFSGWIRWGRTFGDHHTVQLEMRRQNLERDTTAFGPGEGARRDLILRARTAPLPGFVAEAYAGESAVEDATGEARIREASTQVGLRGRFERGDAWAAADLRTRSNRNLPGLESELAAGVRLPGGGVVSGELLSADWRDGARATAYAIRSEAAPIRGVRLAAEWSDGHHGIPFLRDSLGGAVLTERSALRIGGSFSRGGLMLGAAGIRVATDSVADFGLPFDATSRLYPGGTVRGWEFTGRVPVVWRPLAIDGAYTVWRTGNPWIYLPTSSWRTALTFHDLPLASGNLELLARIEARHRGSMPVPVRAETQDDSSPGSTVEIVPSSTTLDFLFMLRIMDVRAFIRWENLLNRLDLHDLPGRTHPGQRVFYGVQWQFWN